MKTNSKKKLNLKYVENDDNVNNDQNFKNT